MARPYDIDQVDGHLAELLEKGPDSERIIVYQGNEALAVILGMNEYKAMCQAINRPDMFDEIMAALDKSKESCSE